MFPWGGVPLFIVLCSLWPASCLSRSARGAIEALVGPCVPVPVPILLLGPCAIGVSMVVRLLLLLGVTASFIFKLLCCRPLVVCLVDGVPLKVWIPVPLAGVLITGHDGCTFDDTLVKAALDMDDINKLRNPP